ncbi:uncharacterized protein MCYG_02787 [Microsporum canis CBS 113480]|uniref:Uncharacterized protein n=1 Tax=Arthroderma otae (strain ATCC MYA-4605 / CBS 113480) TaxID=554155 RepID=C5FGT3_ARTOC|nr:uncharacterized protein MCYG_02787 [Microsporum canis CBS 113480]EEQ29968.1 predicted protein [Microsporum canis CBS 113480]
MFNVGLIRCSRAGRLSTTCYRGYSGSHDYPGNFLEAGLFALPAPGARSRAKLKAARGFTVLDQDTSAPVIGTIVNPGAAPDSPSHWYKVLMGLLVAHGFADSKTDSTLTCGSKLLRPTWIYQFLSSKETHRKISTWFKIYHVISWGLSG